MTRTQGERIASLETEVRLMKEALDNQKTAHEDMSLKLDQLLSLRDRGAGAFWLATALAGTGAISIFLAIAHALQGWWPK